MHSVPIVMSSRAWSKTNCSDARTAVCSIAYASNRELKQCMQQGYSLRKRTIVYSELPGVCIGARILCTAIVP